VPGEHVVSARGVRRQRPGPAVGRVDRGFANNSASASLSWSPDKLACRGADRPRLVPSWEVGKRRFLAQRDWDDEQQQGTERTGTEIHLLRTDIPDRSGRRRRGTLIDDLMDPLPDDPYWYGLLRSQRAAIRTRPANRSRPLQLGSRPGSVNTIAHGNLLRLTRSRFRAVSIGPAVGAAAWSADDPAADAAGHRRAECGYPGSRTSASNGSPPVSPEEPSAPGHVGRVCILTASVVCHVDHCLAIAVACLARQKPGAPGVDTGPCRRSGRREPADNQTDTAYTAKWRPGNTPVTDDCEHIRRIARIHHHLGRRSPTFGCRSQLVATRSAQTDCAVPAGGLPYDSIILTTLSRSTRRPRLLDRTGPEPGLRFTRVARDRAV